MSAPGEYGPLVVGVGVILRWEKCILLGKRIGSHGSGVFAASGGKPEPGESPQEGGIREVKEETNLDVASITQMRFWSYDEFPEANKHFITVWFHATVANPLELKTMEPHKCEGWGWWPERHLPGPRWSSLAGALKELGLGQATSTS